MEGYEFISANYKAIFIKTIWSFIHFTFHVCRFVCQLSWVLVSKDTYWVNMEILSLATATKMRPKKLSADDSGLAWYEANNSFVFDVRWDR